jgi:hypothetical protein
LNWHDYVNNVAEIGNNIPERTSPAARFIWSPTFASLVEAPPMDQRNTGTGMLSGNHRIRWRTLIDKHMRYFTF